MADWVNLGPLNHSLHTLAPAKRFALTNAQRLFHKLNRQYFNGQLPEYRVVVSDEFGLGSHGLCRKEEREIHVGTSLRGKELTKALLHEMAHAAVPKRGHGKAWSAEMERLAKMGAPTRKDFEAYQDRLKTITEKDMESEAFDMGCEWDISWAQARPIIGLEYGLTNAHGRSESKRAAKLMQRLRRQFCEGRRLLPATPVVPPR